MQYVLTKEEYDNLVSKEKYYKMLDLVVLLNEKVLEVAKFRCIHDKGCGYCDDCPISGIGSCTKTTCYSK